MEWTAGQVEKYLKEVRDRLADGRISEVQLKMSEVFTAASCGSIGCIGGWAVHLRQVDEGLEPHIVTMLYPFTMLYPLVEATAKMSHGRAIGLDRLFFVWPGREGSVPIGDAIAAIDRWLVGSNNPWVPA